MPGTGAGWDSCFYRIFIVGGLAGVVGAVVASTLLAPDGSKLPLYVGFAAISIFFGLLLAYWWFQLAVKGYGTPDLPPEQAGTGRPNLQDLQSWDSLFRAMVIRGGNAEEMKKYRRQSQGGLLIWFGMASLLALFVLVSMGLYMFGIIPAGWIRYIGLAVPVLAIGMYVVSLFLVGGVTRANEYLFLAPLGLSLMGLPSVAIVPTGDGARTDVSGSTLIGGQRFGRSVRVELGFGRATTQVVVPQPDFEIRSDGGKLEAGTGTPSALIDVLKGLRKAGRWDGLTLRGGPDGLRAERSRRGEKMWLYDLWLIERLLDNQA